MDLNEVLKLMESMSKVEFKPHAFFNRPGDLLEVFFENVPHYGEWVNPEIYLLRAQDDNRVVGCQVWKLSKVMAR